MKLIYNSVDVAALGTFRILGHSTRRDPPEAPQRELVTVRCRLDFFEQSYQANHALIEEFRRAVRTQRAQCLWQDESGNTLVERPVTIGDDDVPEDGMAVSGTTRQAVTFTFWYYNHTVASQCLAATYQRSGGALLTLGNVFKHAEALEMLLVAPMRDPRERVQGTVRVNGAFLAADTTQPAATRQAALQAVKDQWLAELAAGARGRFVFGTFNRDIRVTRFTAEVDQNAEAVPWSLEATFTAYPDEANYALVEVKVDSRLNKAEGIQYLTLSGRIRAATETAARTRLTALRAALKPSGYVTQTEEVSPSTVTSESGSGGDGSAFLELTFSVVYRDISTAVCTFQRTGRSKQDLGTVDESQFSHQNALLDEMRDPRARATGRLGLRGKWFAADGLSESETANVLQAKLAAMRLELASGTAGALNYGSAFAETVRVLDFDAVLGRSGKVNCIVWSLSATWSVYPNEANYAICRLTLGTRENKQEGTVVRSITGTIGAPTAELALDKLRRLRAAFIPPGYALISEGPEERRVDSESGGTGDGAAFVELAVHDEWQAAADAILQYALRIVTEEDVRSGWVRMAYSGTVTAHGTTQAEAFEAARAQAETLGMDKHPFFLRGTVVENQKRFQTTGGVVFVTVEFNYDYQVRGTRVYVEVVSERSEDTFGQTVETVAGVIAAETLAAAEAVYQADVRGSVLHAGALVLSERRPTRSEQRLGSGETAVSLMDRFAFQLVLWHPKSEAQASVVFETEVDGDLAAVEQTTTLRGTVYASSEAQAQSVLTTLLTGLGYEVDEATGRVTPPSGSKRVRFRRGTRSQDGPRVSGDRAPVFLALDWQETSVAVLTGVSGILFSEVEEDVQHSGLRLVARPVPGAVDVVQGADGALGTASGRREVTARAVGVTRTACDTWLRTIPAALMTSPATALPPRVRTVFKTLAQTALVPSGEGANVKVVEVTAQFAELLTEAPFV